MEAAAALREDGRTEEAAGEGTEGLSLGFGCGSPHLHRPPHHKLLRSDAFPFRVASSSSHAAAGVSTASDGRAAGPPPSPARTLASPPNSGVNVGGGGGGTAALGHGGISDSADSYGTPRALRPVNSPVTGLAGDATLQLCSSFTAAQWQELHRQALIFKCFVTATPVPPDLLPTQSPFSGGHPFFSNLSRGGDYLNLRFTGANADLEPGRCRRTDGKKWRCSREVAPGQKYCERHVHRARPRSRKPVELAGRADPAAAAINAAETVSTAGKPAAARPSAQSSPAGLPASGADDLKLPFQFLVPEDHKKLRYLGSSGGVRAEVLPATKQYWQLPHPKMGLLQQHNGDNRLNLRCSSLNHDHHGCPFPGTDISASDADPHDPRDAPRCFIDAWSRSENPFDGVTIGDDHKTDSGGGGVRSLEYLSPSSSLTLSMSGTGVGGGEHHDHFHMGIHAADSPAGKMLAPSWMRRPASPIGGPLAEVLQATSSTVSFRDVERAGRHEHDAAARGSGGLIDLMCRTSCDSEGTSPPRGFSSPTRVLQKALVSPSDSSSNSNSSPTFGLGRIPELGLQWASPYN